jgi:hypothetical protein
MKIQRGQIWQAKDNPDRKVRVTNNSPGVGEGSALSLVLYEELQTTPVLECRGLQYPEGGRSALHRVRFVELFIHVPKKNAA